MNPNPPTPVAAFISLGSNLGDSIALVNEAAKQLAAMARGPVLQSSLWATPPVDCPPGSPGFVNAVMGFTVPERTSPSALLGALQQLELEFGRRPKRVMNEPRPLDLDLIAFGGQVLQSPTLTLPHPRAHLRHFVLIPWAEIAPDFIIPGLGLRVQACLEQLGANPDIRRLPPDQSTRTR